MSDVVVFMKEEKDIIEAGIYQAVCTKVFDLGMQKVEYNGEVSYKPKIAIFFELEETIKSGEYEGKRIVKSKVYTASLYSKSNLTRDLIGWRGRSFTGDEILEYQANGFNFNKLIGVNCMLTLVEIERNGKKYINIDAIAPKMKNLKNMTPELPDDWCPEWITKKMNEGRKISTESFVPRTEFEDDIPF